jgi:hypothetical protein
MCSRIDRVCEVFDVVMMALTHSSSLHATEHAWLKSVADAMGISKLHSTQTSMSSHVTTRDPALHSEHTVIAVDAYVPSAHAWHVVSDVALSASENVLKGHGVQKKLPS